MSSAQYPHTRFARMKPFQRKPTLGHYNECREVWVRAYRQARIEIGSGLQPDSSLCGVHWKAQLVVAYERDGGRDRLLQGAQEKLWGKRLIEELLSESEVLR